MRASLEVIAKHGRTTNWCRALRFLVVLNNHNSFAIVDLCADLQRQDPAVTVDTVCTPEFALANRGNFQKRGLVPRFLDPAAVFGLEATNRSFSGVKAIERDARSSRNRLNIAARLKHFFVRQISYTSVYALAREWVIVRRFRVKQKQALNLLAQLKTDVVFSLSDRSHDYVEGPVLWAARRRRVPIVLPYVAQFDIDAAVTYRHGADGRPEPELRPFHPFSLYKLHSYRRLQEQVYRGLFFQAPYVLNAARRVGILSSYPWWTGNGLSDVVCVDTRYTEEQYAKYRVPREKLSVVGHVHFDKIYQSQQRKECLRESLIEQYRLDKKKALLILSVPQYAEQGYMPWSAHWREIDRVVYHASNSGLNLLLSVHPRSDVREYRFLEKKYNCQIAEEALADVLSAADIFLASNSSTLIWSVMLGIRSISVSSPIKYLYSHLSSITHVQDSAKIEFAIRDILTDPQFDFSQDWELLSKNKVFDGRFGERFMNILREQGI